MKRKRYSEEKVILILKEHQGGATAMDLARRHGVAQNAFVESFNGKFREYCIDLHWFASLGDAGSTIQPWRLHYKHVRPHRSLGKKPPAVFAKEPA